MKSPLCCPCHQLLFSLSAAPVFIGEGKKQKAEIILERRATVFIYFYKINKSLFMEHGITNSTSPKRDEHRMETF